MIVRKSMSPGWLSNTWLVGDEPGGKAIVVDSGGPLEPIAQAIEAERLEPTHLLCTHHHPDHVAHNDAYRERYGCLVAGGRAERDLFGPLDLELDGGEVIETGGLRVRTLHIPGHTRGQLGFLVDEERVFTGDTLFRGSVGGTRGPGHTTFEDLHRSIMDVLMALPPGTEVHPGHTDPTTIGREWEENPFVRLWRGLDAPADRPCRAFGRAAVLLLRAPDYDGGTKCLVRFVEDDRTDVVPGSKVED